MKVIAFDLIARRPSDLLIRVLLNILVPYCIVENLMKLCQYMADCLSAKTVVYHIRNEILNGFSGYVMETHIPKKRDKPLIQDTSV